MNLRAETISNDVGMAALSGSMAIVLAIFTAGGSATASLSGFVVSTGLCVAASYFAKHAARQIMSPT